MASLHRSDTTKKSGYLIKTFLLGGFCGFRIQGSRLQGFTPDGLLDDLLYITVAVEKIKLMMSVFYFILCCSFE